MEAPHPALRWHTSSYSGVHSNCVEVARAPARALVRDSKRHACPVIDFPAGPWASFVAVVARGD